MTHCNGCGLDLPPTMYHHNNRPNKRQKCKACIKARTLARHEARAMDYRTCPGCGESKLGSEYYPQSVTFCKACHRAHMKHENREQRAVKRRAQG